MQHKTLTFGSFTLDAARGALMKGDVELRLRPKSFEVLRFLVENPGRLVTKDEIFAAVWGGTIVTDDSLTQCLIEIRRAIGDETREVVRTVPRRGYVFELPVQEAGAVPPAETSAATIAPLLPRRWLLAALAVAAVAVLAWWGVARKPADVPGAAAARANSIAVLAFADMSEGRDHEYLADGVSEEILNLLTRIPGLDVVARTSSFSFKGKNADIPEIGRALDVAYVLEGSVRRAGDRVRVTAQLVDAATSLHVWSETYDRDLDDLLALQSEIAERIATTLQVELADLASVTAARPVNPDAHEHYLYGRYLHNRRGAGDLLAAERHLRSAVAIDGGYAPAWAALAGTVLVRLFEEHGDPAIAMEEVRQAVTRALALDPSLPEAHVRAAHYYFAAGDFALSRSHRERARELDPDHPLVIGAQILPAMSRQDQEQAIELQRRMVRRDPLNAVARSNLLWQLAVLGKFEEAAREFQRLRDLSPDWEGLDRAEAELLVMQRRYDEALVPAGRLEAGPEREQFLAMIHYGSGREADAEAALRRMRGYEDPAMPLRMAEIHAQRGAFDEAFTWLPRARDADIANALTPGEKSRPFEVLNSALLLPLRADPRWSKIIASDELFP